MVSGNFLDFVVAIVCLILILRTPKVIRHFLDMLIPGGPGPGGLGHAMMEGLGFAVGGKIASGAVKGGATAASLGASAGIGGVAMMAQNHAAKSALPKLGSSVAGMGQSMASSMGANSPASLYPASLPTGSKATALLGDGQAKSSPGFGAGDGFVFRDLTAPQQDWSGNTAEQEFQNPFASGERGSVFAEQASFGNSAFTDQPGSAAVGPTTGGATPDSRSGLSQQTSSASAKAEPYTAGRDQRQRRSTQGQSSSWANKRAFDPSSQRGGAFTRVSPSAMSRLWRTGELGKMSAMEAFATGAGERFKNDFKHRVIDGKKGYHGANGKTNRTLLGVAAEAMSSTREDMQASEFMRNSLVPRDELMTDWNNGEPLAGEALYEIGQQQMELQVAYNMVESADEMAAVVDPAYEEAEYEYNAAESEWRQISTVLLEMRVRRLTGSPEYQQAEAQQKALESRRNSAREAFNARSEQKTNITEMRKSGEARMQDARERIYQLNMGYNPANARQRDIETAVRRSGRRTFSDLSW